MYSIQQQMDMFFNNSGGGGINYGGTGVSGGYGSIAGGSGGNSSGEGRSGGTAGRPYDPRDYDNHIIQRDEDWHQEGHWNGTNTNGERCDGWVSTYNPPPVQHVRYPECEPTRPLEVSWRKGSAFDLEI